MGEGDPRQSKRHKPAAVHSPVPAKPAARPGPRPTARNPTVMSKLAGSQKLPVTRMPAVLRSAAAADKPGADKPGAPLISRTATLDDPLTTSLLAEVTRRSRTIEVSPEQIDEAMDLEPGDHDPDDPA